MNDPITDYGEGLCAAHVAQTVSRLSDVLANDVPPDVTVEVSDNDIVLSGKNLVARYAADVRLNGIEMTARAVLS